MGVEPVKLNSSLTSAQNRVRLYWANFNITEPLDLGIKLEDILDLPTVYEIIEAASGVKLTDASDILAINA